jgi:hypothetical protein
VCALSLKAGLFTYKARAGDGLQLTLRVSFQPRLTRGVAMTSDVKGGEQLFLGLHNVFAHRASEEAEPVRNDG